MLNKLFGSRARVQILSHFIQNPGKRFYPQEVIRATGLNAANTLREIRRLCEIGILGVTKEGGKQFYSLNTGSPLTAGLSGMFSTSTRPHFGVVEALPKDAKNLLHGKKWYHQRFDGTPLFINFIAEAELRQEKRKPLGTEADVRVCFFNDTVGDWYLDMADIARGAGVIEKLATKDPEISRKLLAAWKKDEDEFESFFWNEFPKIDFKAMSNQELVDFWDRYYEMVISRLTSSALIDHFALGTDEKIQNILRKEIYGQDAGRSLGNAEFGKVFATLTAPVHQSFINHAHIDLLKIGTGRSKETLDSYRDRYFWVTNNYADAHDLPTSYFKKDLAVWREKEDLDVELDRLIATPSENLKKKKALLRTFKLSKNLQTLIRISEDFSWWQDERKKATFLNIHVGTQFLKAIAERTKYRVPELRYCVPPELTSVLLHGSPSREELAKRAKHSAVISTRDGFHVVSGKDADDLKKLMFEDEALDEVEDVRGLPACLGRAVGTVKVIQSAKEISKVQQGDILVAVMTRPDYVPAMRKAAAIVTNEGGITSHAAIVSRELGIPCLIGTKIATKIFHDGDRVEVNANHGWARRVK